jgi:tetratricopeptide (TPR) repeat protein
MKAAMLRILATLMLAAAGFAGEPLYDLYGQVRPTGPASISLFGAVTPFDASASSIDGRFRFRKLLPGTYTVAVFSPGRGEARRTVEVGPSTAGSRRRVSIELNFAPGDFTLAEAARRHVISARDLAIPDRAQRDYDEARKALSRRDTASAVSHLERAVETAPQFSAAWNELGTIAYQTQNFARAEECFVQALDQDPRAYEPLVNLGGVEVTLHKTERALDYNIQAVLAHPNDALANSQLGMAYFQAGNNELALKYLETARHLDPAHFSHPQLLMAEIHLRRNERTAAAADLEDFLKFHPDWPKAVEMRQAIAQWQQ